MKSSKGFTLIEVLVAITILAMISSLTWQAMSSSASSKERFARKEESFRGASLALNRMVADLQSAVLFASPDLLGANANGEQMTKSVFIGKNAGDRDRITFNTIAHLRYLKETRETDLAEVSYFLDQGEENSNGTLSLKKRESSPPDAEPEEGGPVLTLLDGVKELNFRYYNVVKQQFDDQWDTTSSDYVNRLPRAVEINLALQDPVDEEKTLKFSTVVLLEMAPGPNDF